MAVRFLANRRCVQFLRVLAAAGCIVCGTVTTGQGGPYPGENDGSALEVPVYLYFGELEGRYLTGEPVAFENGGDALLYCRNIIDGLIEGPKGASIPTIPEKTRLRAVFIDGRTAYVDFSREISEMHPGGVRSELLTVYSIVNTLILNVESVDRVKILIEGNEAETLAGHIAIDYPLTAQLLLVR